MKRKVVYAGVPYFIGLLLTSFLDRTYDFTVAVIVIIGLFFLKYVCKMTNKELAVCGISFVLAFTWYRTYEKLIYEKTVSYIDQTVQFSGKVIGITDYSDDKFQLILKGKINSECNAEVIYFGTSVNSDYGDKIEIRGTVKEFENSYKFNSLDYYKSKGIFLQFDKISEISIKNNSNFSFFETILHYRTKILHIIKRILPENEGDILAGILFGDKSGLSSVEKTVFYRSGIGHIMSVSGLHVVILSSILYLLLKNIGMYKWHIFIIIEFVILLFAICSGFSMSVIRAFIMVTLTGSSVLFFRKADVLNSLCIAVLLITINNPFAIRDASFLLSVSGAFGIGVFAQYMTVEISSDTFIHKIKKDFLVFTCVTLVILPVSILFFDETSIISPFTNIVLIPFCTVALICGLLVVLTGGLSFFAYPLLTVAGLCCKIVAEVSEFLAKIYFTHIALGNKFFEWTVLLLTFFIIITYALYKSRKTIAISLCLSVLLLSFENIMYKSVQKDILKIAVLGTGKSLALVISKNNFADIVDLTGKGVCTDYINIYMKSMGISNINTLCILQSQYSSMTSYNEILELENVGKVILPENTYLFDKACLNTKDVCCSDFKNLVIEYDDYSITLYNSGYIDIKYNDFTLGCFNGIYEKKADICVNYGKYTNQTIICSYYVVLDNTKSISAESNIFIGENNLIFEADSKGKIKAGRLIIG